MNPRLKQLLGTAAIAFLAFSLIKNPGMVGHFVHDTIHAAQTAVSNAGSFFNKSKS